MRHRSQNLALTVVYVPESGLDCLICAIDCLICASDCLICVIDCLICAVSVRSGPGVAVVGAEDQEEGQRRRRELVRHLQHTQGSQDQEEGQVPYKTVKNIRQSSAGLLPGPGHIRQSRPGRTAPSPKAGAAPAAVPFHLIRKSNQMYYALTNIYYALTNIPATVHTS